MAWKCKKCGELNSVYPHNIYTTLDKEGNILDYSSDGYKCCDCYATGYHLEDLADWIDPKKVDNK